ncbi:MAG: M20/M25/M40 family metallo-hydrolase [Gracilibacteraceae bacterium]|jgi:endoglucanase|nr:M20/M25/M40 family metallo-hydrolase [Gracilibacteraceae bacterium]
MPDSDEKWRLLRELTAAFGPSGQEDEVRRLIATTATARADEIREDTLGSLIVRRRPATGGGRRVMICAHMDEIGVMTTHIDEAGFLRFAPVGGFRTAQMEGQRLRFQSGLTAVLARQFLEPGQDKTENRRYYLDTGLGPEALAAQGIDVGAMAVFAAPLTETAATVSGKALDNRIGCFVLLEALRRVRSRHDLYFVFSAQEEVGLRGAKTAAFALEPDAAYIVDTTIADDIPRNPVATLRLGAGPAVKVMDRTIVVAPARRDAVAALAQSAGIPFQWEIIDRGGTDAGPVHLSRGGVATAGIAVPVRYIHSPAETAAKSDILQACDLLVRCLEADFPAESG